MKIYFLSSRPCALSVGGAYFGITDRFERFASVCLSDNLLITFTPENALPLSFFLNENIRFTAPAGVEVYLFKDAIALYARDFPLCDFTLRPIAQARENDLLVSVFKQGNLQVSFQSDKGFFVQPLRGDFEKCEISFHEQFIFLRAEKTLAVFTATGDKLFEETVESFTVENNELCAKIPINENAYIQGTWQLLDGACSQKTLSLVGQANTNTIDALLPYAFFESVRIGANIDAMLSEELLPEKEKILSFLDDFVFVSPTTDENTCALMRQKGERLFEASYFTAQVEHGKIVDIIQNA